MVTDIFGTQPSQVIVSLLVLRGLFKLIEWNRHVLSNLVDPKSTVLAIFFFLKVSNS